MATLHIDEEVLRKALTSKHYSPPSALDDAGCPQWLTAWLVNTYLARYRDKQAGNRTYVADEAERAKVSPAAALGVDTNKLQRAIDALADQIVEWIASVRERLE
jgi:hypothetical protein